MTKTLHHSDANSHPSTTTPSNTTGHFPHPLILKEITGGIRGLHTAATSIKYDGPLNDDLAYRIKQQSNDNSCQPILGKHGSVSWKLYVRTSGKRCDTTTELNTIRDYVGFATDAMTWYSYDVACVRMRHGKGTWVGYLQLQDHDRRGDIRGIFALASLIRLDFRGMGCEDEDEKERLGSVPRDKICGTS